MRYFGYEPANDIIKVYPNVAHSIWHINLTAIKIIGTCMVLLISFIIFVNNLLIFLDLVI